MKWAEYNNISSLKDIPRAITCRTLKLILLDFQVKSSRMNENNETAEILIFVLMSSVSNSTHVTRKSIKYVFYSNN